MLREVGAIQARSQIGRERTTCRIVIDKTVLRKFDKNPQTSPKQMNASWVYLYIFPTFIAFWVSTRNTHIIYKDTGIVCWWLYPTRFIRILVFAKVGRTAGFSIVDFVFGWILFYTERFSEPAQNAHMNTWKPRVVTYPYTLTMFSRKRLSSYYRWLDNSPLLIISTPRWKYYCIL